MAMNGENGNEDNENLHQMTTFLSVTATAPAGAIGFSLWRLWFRLGSFVCCFVCCGCGGVWSDRKEAEESGNITAVNIEKSSLGIIGKIRIR